MSHKCTHQEWISGLNGQQVGSDLGIHRIIADKNKSCRIMSVVTNWNLGTSKNNSCNYYIIIYPSYTLLWTQFCPCNFFPNVAHGWDQPNEWAASQSGSDTDWESLAGNGCSQIQSVGGLARNEPRVRNCIAQLLMFIFKDKRNVIFYYFELNVLQTWLQVMVPFQ